MCLDEKRKEERSIKREKLQKITAPLCFLGAALIAVLLVIYAGQTFVVDDIALDNEAVHPFNEAWTEVGTGQQISFPYVWEKELKTVVFSKTIPEDLAGDQVLCLESNHQQVRAFVDGQQVYEYGFQNKHTPGKLFGNVWNLIPIPEEAAGRTVTIALAMPYERLANSASEIVMGSKSAVIFYLVKSNLGKIGFCIITMLFGCLFLFFAALMKKRTFGTSRSSFFYLGIFAVLTSVWTLTDMKVLQFVTGNKAAVYLASFFSFMLLPIPFLLFIRELCKRGKRVMDGLAVVFVVIFLISAFLYFAGKAELMDTVIAEHIMIAVAILCILWVCFVEKIRYHNAEVQNVLVGMCVLCLFAVMALVQFYHGDNSDNSRFFRYGILIFLVMLGTVAMKKSVTVLQADAQFRAYKRMAYNDAMTMLGNRAAFDRDMDEIREHIREYHSIGVALFDLNHLKQTNDTKGHAVGDELIRGTAQCIRRSFSSIGQCYRIGGDEFVVIIKNRLGVETAAAFESFEQELRRYNKTHENCLQVAFGCAAEDAALEKDTPNRLFQQADARMYEQKLKSRNA